ncbi:MAG: type III polyketide synthase [Ferruginibacter sp.]
MSKIISIATGVPGYKHLQTDLFSYADEVYNKTPDDSRKLGFLYRQSGIEYRHSVMADFSMPEDERTFFATAENKNTIPDIGERMKIYNEFAPTLSVNTIEKCIEGKINKDKITHLITVSCTGMSAPGLDLQVMELMGLPNTLVRTSVNFMGCYAAIHAMKIADAFCNSTPNANVIVVCTEFCTLHFQKEFSVDNLTSSLLFADGCAAILMQGNEAGEGLSIENFYSDVIFKGKKDMSWSLSSSGFLMTLSGYIPELIKADFEKLVAAALEKTGRKKEDVTNWCIHPGGKKILQSIAESLDLQKEDFRPSYEVLNNYGNMSSPTILFVLQKIMNELKESKEKNAVVFGAAFGPGLTMETFTAIYD